MSASRVRAVLDTNVFVTALLHGATPRRVYDAFLRGKLIPVLSRQTLAELIDVLTRPGLRALTSKGEVESFLTLIQRDGLIVQPTHQVRACRDPKDNRILECALAGSVDVIVTGDHDLLVLDPFRGIRILRPAEFLHLLS